MHGCLGELLLAALKDGDVKCATMLIKAGASVNFEHVHFKNKTEAVHHYAANFFFNHPALPDEDTLVSYLIEDINCKTCESHSPAGDSSGEDIGQAENILYRHLGRRADTPLSTAVETHNMDAIVLLLQNGASIQTDCGIRQDTNSIYNVPHQTPLSIAIERNYPNVVATFIDHGLNINKDVEKTTFESCSDQCLLVLLKAGLHHNKIQQNSSLAIAAGRNGDSVPEDDDECGLTTLKFSCRKKIRHTLLRHNKENLIFTASYSKLPLPKPLCNYIICNALPV